MSSVVPFPAVPSEFTGLNGEQIDRHPLRAYMQGLAAGLTLASNGAKERQEFWRKWWQQRSAEFFFKGVEAAFYVSPPTKPKAPRGRQKGTSEKITWEELRPLYVWLMRRQWVHQENLAAACRWLSQRVNMSEKTLRRRYALIESGLKSGRPELADVLKEVDFIKHTLILEHWRHKGLTAEDLKRTEPAAIERWRTFKSPLLKDPSRRRVTPKARDK